MFDSIWIVTVVVSVLVPLLITGIVIWVVMRARKGIEQGIGAGSTVVDLRSGTTTTYSAGGITIQTGGQTVMIPTGGPAASPVGLAFGQQQLPAQQRLAAIAAHDPNLRAEKLYTMAEACFHDFYEHWRELNPEPMRWRLDDGIYSAYEEQLRQIAKDGRRSVIERLHVRSMDLVGADHTHELDSVTFRIEWEWVDYETDAAGKVVKGSTDLVDHVEDWTFTRDGMAVTEPESRETRCPECGAPLSEGQRGACRYCGTRVTGARDHWVLSRIHHHR